MQVHTTETEPADQTECLGSEAFPPMSPLEPVPDLRLPFEARPVYQPYLADGIVRADEMYGEREPVASALLTENATNELASALASNPRWQHPGSQPVSENAVQRACVRQTQRPNSDPSPTHYS